MDGYEDCPNNYDERYEKTCDLNMKHRYKCSNINQCIPRIMLNDNVQQCLDGGSDEYSYEICYNSNSLQCEYLRYDNALSTITKNSNIVFQQICNGMRDPFYVNETDETDCDLWPCVTEYTICDTYWNCKTGIDELNCNYGEEGTSEFFSVQYAKGHNCPDQTQYCVKIDYKNYSRINNMTCISITEVNNNHIDCLGASDERDYCRRAYPNERTLRYKCLNSTKCISPTQLCDCKKNCDLGDDETHVCPWLTSYKCDSTFFTCSNGYQSKRQYHCNGWNECGWEFNLIHGGNDEIFCDLIEKPKFKYLSINNFDVYPANASSSLLIITSYQNKQQNYLPAQKQQIAVTDVRIDVKRSFYCNYGFLIRTNQNELKCLCSPNYYATDLGGNNIYKILVTLIDNETDVIVSYEQLTFIPIRNCMQKYVFYLLSKVINRNYYVRIHAYDLYRNQIEYRASWYYDIKFNFLPVNRLTIKVYIPVKPSISLLCTQCNKHGQCKQYVNNNQSIFCLCDPGWTGKYCDIKYKCKCSIESLCINNEICICPENKMGSLCYIPYSVCKKKENICAHNGTCLAYDSRFNLAESTICSCPVGYSGKSCHIANIKVDISFGEITNIPSVILIHSIHTHHVKDPTRKTYFQRISSLYQRTFSVYYSPDNFPKLIYTQLGNEYYLAALLTKAIQIHTLLSTTIISSNQCFHVERLLNSKIMLLDRINRVKFYHQICIQNLTKLCFYDETFMCLCTNDRQADCFTFNHNVYGCENSDNYCENNGRCIQNEDFCPTNSLCICSECYYGGLCQFSTTGYDLTLDGIIGLHIQRDVSIQEQAP
ncbi:unnamed protein product [Didymodactylos carnosus]|uniref:EGF-like domain-containing protein n=1 Tax=Didymodactylos carnosus TaxID=1234261 RepID=A0A815AKT9_9BILA|nr:unnamed protein product [Didymodactylos carnosus]CAF4038452.1 unnamed protein product [Didymodactylos carnosus]